jgi:translation initiation factor 2B subunit (eIF-2B alpha/beta/delta family)
MGEREVVTCFLRHGTEVLLVRRGETAGRYPGRWGGVSGCAEKAPEAAARRAVDECVGLDAATLVRGGDALALGDDSPDTRRRVHPFLFECAEAALDPAEGVAAHEWVQPPALLRRETVPGLWEAYLAVAPDVGTVRADTDHGAAYLSVRALEALRDRAADVALRDGAATRADGEDDDEDDGREPGDGGPDDGREAVLECARRLRAARPNMAVLRTRIDRVVATADDDAASVWRRAERACRAALEADAEAADEAAARLGDRVLTLSRSGTVLEALCRADPSMVAVAESRPGGEGVTTAETLAEAGIETTLLADAATGRAVEALDIDTVLFGADSVLADGTVRNKTGSDHAALAAARAGVDCLAVCSRDKIAAGDSGDDGQCSGHDDGGGHRDIYDGDAAVRTFAPAFEPVAADLLDGIVTEAGVLSPADVESVAAEHARLARWTER